MSYSLTLRCDGTIGGRPCRVEYARGFPFGPSITRDEVALLALDAVTDLAHTWRTAPGGGDLCPNTGHDEDGPQ